MEASPPEAEARPAAAGARPSAGGGLSPPAAWSLLRVGAGARLGGASGLVVAMWAVVLWALG